MYHSICLGRRGRNRKSSDKRQQASKGSTFILVFLVTQTPVCPVCHIELTIDLGAEAVETGEEKKMKKQGILGRLDLAVSQIACLHYDPLCPLTFVRFYRIGVRLPNSRCSWTNSASFVKRIATSSHSFSRNLCQCWISRRSDSSGPVSPSVDSKEE